MILPLPPNLRGFGDHLSEVYRVLVKEDERNFKKGADLRLVQGERLILASPNGTRYIVTVDDAGTLGSTAL